MSDDLLPKAPGIFAADDDDDDEDVETEEIENSDEVQDDPPEEDTVPPLEKEEEGEGEEEEKVESEKDVSEETEGVVAVVIPKPPSSNIRRKRSAPIKRKARTVIDENNKKEKKKRRFRPGTQATRECVRLQRTYCTLIPRLIVYRAIKDKLAGTDLRITAHAVDALQQAVEDQAHRFFVHGKTFMEHAGRVELNIKDARLAKKYLNGSF